MTIQQQKTYLQENPISLYYIHSQNYADFEDQEEPIKRKATMSMLASDVGSKSYSVLSSLKMHESTFNDNLVNPINSADNT